MINESKFIKNIFAGLFVTVIGGLIVYYVTEGRKSDPINQFDGGDKKNGDKRIEELQQQLRQALMNSQKAKQEAEQTKKRLEAEAERIARVQAEAERIARVQAEAAKALLEAKEAARRAQQEAEQTKRRLEAEAAGAAEEEQGEQQGHGENAGRSAPSEPSTLEIGKPTYWDHNGSIMRLEAVGSRRTFYYENPRQGMRSEGVSRGTMLFSGERIGDEYHGTARVFSKLCGPRSYRVSGVVALSQRSVVLKGKAPRLDVNCKTVGWRTDVLRFELLPGQ